MPADAPHRQAIQKAIETGSLNAEIVITVNQFDTAALSEIEPSQIDLIVTARFEDLPDAFFSSLKDRILKVHPSLLPAFPGKDAPQKAIEYGVKASGCTIYFLSGEIMAQSVVPVYESDTPPQLAERILQQECRVLPEIINMFTHQIESTINE